MIYAKYARGNKGGGFNSNTTGQATDPTFENEVVDSYELGAKLRMDEGYVNIALFRQDFDNLQTSVWTGADFDVGNAGEARSQGLELDGRYELSDQLEINGSLIYLDATFIDNKQNACSVPQLSFGAPGCFDLNGAAFGTTGATAPYFQDLTDERFATQLQGNLGMGYRVPIFGRFELLTRVDMNYTGHQENPRDRTIEQPSLTTLDISATLRQDTGPWSIGLLIKNATDEEYWYYEFEAPAQPGTRIGYLAPPRTYTLRFSYDYQ
jgi:outer membrane receptor protein involved in Fe transport